MLLQARFALLWIPNQLQVCLNQGCPCEVNLPHMTLPQHFAEAVLSPESIPPLTHHIKVWCIY